MNISILDSLSLNPLQEKWKGLDGLIGPILSGTGFYMKREALYGTQKLQNGNEINFLRYALIIKILLYVIRAPLFMYEVMSLSYRIKKSYSLYLFVQMMISRSISDRPMSSLSRFIIGVNRITKHLVKIHCRERCNC